METLQATLCSNQLHNLYTTLNSFTTGSTIVPVIDYVTGYSMPGNVSYVSVLIHIADTAAYYTDHVFYTVNPVPSISYVSLDIPLCTSEIIVSCANGAQAGMTNKTCTNIIDTDPGYPGVLTGRLYIYLNLNSTCRGTVNVTLMNTYLDSYTSTNRYIYDVSGIITGRLGALDAVTAKEQYRTSGCNYSDGSSIPFATSQHQLACLDKTIACLDCSNNQAGCFIPNTINAVAPSDFSVALTPCTGIPICILLNGSASTQTGTGPLFYKWTLVSGWNLSTIPVLTCNTSGLFNATHVQACVVFTLPGLYKFNLTVYDNSLDFSIDSVYINVVPIDAPLVLPNETIGFYPPPPLRTDPPINRPIIQFPTTPPQPATNPPIENTTYINTTIASLLNRYPPLGTAETLSLFAFAFANAIIFVLFIGFYIAMMSNNETNYLDRIRYFTQ